MKPLQNKTIDSALRYLHSECMNGRHEGKEHVLALMRLRGVEPGFKNLSKPLGIKAVRREGRVWGLV